MKKRILSLIIAVLICILAVFPISAYAADSDSAVTSVDYEMLNVPQIRITTEEDNGTELQKADGYVNAEISITDTDGFGDVIDACLIQRWLCHIEISYVIGKCF